jgi:N12 class adenine-specific DNA methylase
VDVPYIARQCLCSLAEVLTTLKGLIYETPVGTYVTAEEYLLGDVRRKLREAERAAECNPAFAKNVAALQAVQPANPRGNHRASRCGLGAGVHDYLARSGWKNQQEID